MSSTSLLVLVFVALLYTAAAHSHARRSVVPYEWRKRSVSASTCSFMQCAVLHGNCGTNGTTLVFCPAGEHCSGVQCVDNIALGSACNPDAQENECASGSCVDTGNGPICQIFEEIMPGNPCTTDTECYFSQTVDNSGSAASTCLVNTATNTSTCAGRNIGDVCLATHQCVAGSFCSSSTNLCTALGVKGASCAADSECNIRYTCLSSVCTSRYTQAENKQCDETDNCQPGLYCKSGQCAKVSTVGRTSTTCDVASNNCGADQQCSCDGFVTPQQVATCAAIEGTPEDMPAIEQAAYTCLDKYNCGSDADNAATIKCIATNCVSQYCTYITRTVNELFTDYPSCLVSQMVSSQDYYKLLTTCSAYQPKPAQTSTSAALSASCTWALLVVLAIFFFEF